MHRDWIAAALAFLLLQGCALRLQGAPSEPEFRKKVGPQPYIAAPSRAEAILSGARQLDICSRTADVRRLMGEPDFGVVTYDSNGARNAAKWTYLLDEQPAAGGARQAVEVTVNAARDVIDISVYTGSEAYISLVNDGPGCQPR